MTMLDSAPASRRLDGLTGLRGAAALVVVLFHLTHKPFASLGLREWLPPLQIGFTGVDLFFILSGFVISHVHLRDFDRLTFGMQAKFLTLRLARIYPTYLFSLAILVAVTPVAIAAHVPYNAGIKNFSLLPECLLLVQSWHSDGMAWNYPAWSLSAEWFVYLLFPFIAFGIWRLGQGRSILILCLVSILLVRWQVADYFDGPPLVRGTAGFLLGVACYLIAQTYDLSRFPFVTALTISTVLLFWSWGTPAGVFCLLLTYTLLNLACAHRGNTVETCLASRPFLFLGHISYSLYMIHAPIQMIFGEVILRIWPFGRWKTLDITLGCAFLSMIIVSAYLLYSLFELPMRHRLRLLIQQQRGLVKLP